MIIADAYSEKVSGFNVDNVYIYAGDAVRWDILPDSIAEQGSSIKTVSASTTSAPSFSSILTGLYPPSHGVYSFKYRLDEDTQTMLDLPGYNTEFINSIFEFATREHDGVDPIYRMLGDTENKERPTFDESPFIIMERGPGGHAPYGDFDGGATDYFEEHQDITHSELEDDYQRSIERDQGLFEQRLEELSSKGLLGDTLIIYTSDHGELLGEGGMVGHNSPMRPELAYVPTVFIHPSIENTVIDDKVMSHVDLLPTILDILDIDIDSEFDGESIFSNENGGPRCTFYNNEFISNPFPYSDGRLMYDGVWDANGGYVFPNSTRLKRALILAGKLLSSPKRRYLRNNIVDIAREYMAGQRKFGTPDFDQDEGQSILDEFSASSAVGLRQELDEADRERLQDLGYL